MGNGRWHSLGVGRIIAAITLVFLLLWKFTDVVHLNNPIPWFLIALAVAILAL